MPPCGWMAGWSPQRPPGRFHVQLQILLPTLDAPMITKTTSEMIPNTIVPVIISSFLMLCKHTHGGGLVIVVGGLQLKLRIAPGPHFGDVQSCEFRFGTDAHTDHDIRDPV